MNTRLQVEHPVTELVTALDLVKLQIRIAAGEKLPLKQDDVTLRGHAIECRIYAEDPDNNFFPSPGTILERRVPMGPGVRLDDGVYAGWRVPNEYDPMLGKLIAWGADRNEAIARLKRALGEFFASGIKTNVSLFKRILESDDFVKAEIYTRWLDDFLKRPASDIAGAPETSRELDAALIGAALFYRASASGAVSSGGASSGEEGSRWRDESRREQVGREPRA
jgi:acetyl-CoA carboxylase biotin carboxylase subunit